MSVVENQLEETNSDEMRPKTQAAVEQSQKPSGISPTNQSAGDLNDPTPEPPEISKVKLRENAKESAKLDSPERTNDSTIDPTKPKEDILKGFHGG